MATLILGMSNPLGLVLGQTLTPFLVQSPAAIPMLNLVWFLPSLPGFFLTICGVRSSLPPTPPSSSAASAVFAKKRNFVATIWKLTRNFPFLIIFLFLGGAMGYISTLQTKLEQVYICITNNIQGDFLIEQKILLNLTLYLAVPDKFTLNKPIGNSEGYIIGQLDFRTDGQFFISFS